MDLAEVLSPRQLERAFEQAERLRLFDLGALERAAWRCRRRPTNPLLADLIASEHAPPDTHSELERRFLNLYLDAGLPRPALNVVVAGFEVDAVWARERLVVELDGYAFHRSRQAFERDRDRDGALQLAGYRVVRVTHRRLEAEPRAVVHTVRSLLAST